MALQTKKNGHPGRMHSGHDMIIGFQDGTMAITGQALHFSREKSGSGLKRPCQGCWKVWFCGYCFPAKKRVSQLQQANEENDSCLRFCFISKM